MHSATELERIHGRHSACRRDAHDWRAFVVGYALAVGEDMNVCAFGAEFAVSLVLSVSSCLLLNCFHLKNLKGEGRMRTYLCEVFTDVVCYAGEIVTEWTCLACLAGALSEELAWYVAGI